MTTVHEGQSSFELDPESLPKTEEIVPNHKGYSSSDTENFFEKTQMKVWDSVILGRHSLVQTKPYCALRSYSSDDDIQRTSIEKILKVSLELQTPLEAVLSENITRTTGKLKAISDVQLEDGDGDRSDVSTLWKTPPMILVQKGLTGVGPSLPIKQFTTRTRARTLGPVI